MPWASARPTSHKRPLNPFATPAISRYSSHDEVIEAPTKERSSSVDHMESKEAAVAKALFDVLDRDHDGKLTRAEIIRTIRQLSRSDEEADQATMQQLTSTLGLPSGITQEGESRTVFEAVFQAMDKDYDRSITLPEFTTYSIELLD